jgi:hypothetical protein
MHPAPAPSSITISKTKTTQVSITVVPPIVRRTLSLPDLKHSYVFRHFPSYPHYSVASPVRRNEDQEVEERRVKVNGFWFYFAVTVCLLGVQFACKYAHIFIYLSNGVNKSVSYLFKGPLN